MKILDDWKVYGGVSDLKQHAEGIPVSQVIINSNYSDDHDDYDIALMKLSRPLTLSGEASQLSVLGWGWCSGGTESAWGRAGARGSSGPLGAGPGTAASWSIPLCCGRAAFPGLSRGWEAAHPRWQGPAGVQPWARLCGCHGAAGCAARGQGGGGPAGTLSRWAQRGMFPARHPPP